MIIFTPTSRTEKKPQKQNKKVLISHRGNLNGKQPHRENHPSYIDEALNLGYDCEIDFWYHEDKFWLGHDTPQYEIELQWVVDRLHKLWIHCKDLKTLEKLKQLENQGFEFNYLFHNTDDGTITSKGFLWIYPGKQPIENSIAVLPEEWNDDLTKCLGICSDSIDNYKQ